MRYAANPRVYASMRPDPSRVIVDILHLRRFRYSSQVVNQSETERMFRKAKGHLDKLQSASGYWYDTLRIEISGPTQLPLTLIVSLPPTCLVYDAHVNVAIGFACAVQDEDKRSKLRKRRRHTEACSFLPVQAVHHPLGRCEHDVGLRTPAHTRHHQQRAGHPQENSRSHNKARRYFGESRCVACAPSSTQRRHRAQAWSWMACHQEASARTFAPADRLAGVRVL